MAAANTPQSAAGSKTSPAPTSIHPGEATFLVIPCATCQQQVLSARELDEKGRMIDVCVHCDEPLDRDHPSALWLDADALQARGYFVEGHDSLEDRHGGGGCRGGSCGVRQPET